MGMPSSSGKCSKAMFTSSFMLSGILFLGSFKIMITKNSAMNTRKMERNFLFKMNWAEKDAV